MRKKLAVEILVLAAQYVLTAVLLCIALVGYFNQCSFQEMVVRTLTACIWIIASALRTRYLWYFWKDYKEKPKS